MKSIWENTKKTEFPLGPWWWWCRGRVLANRRRFELGSNSGLEIIFISVFTPIFSFSFCDTHLGHRVFLSFLCSLLGLKLDTSFLFSLAQCASCTKLTNVLSVSIICPSLCWSPAYIMKLLLCVSRGGMEMKIRPKPSKSTIGLNF